MTQQEWMEKSEKAMKAKEKRKLSQESQWLC